MLVLSRELGESLILSDKNGTVIAKVIYVKQTGDHTCKLGVDAHPSVNIDREEIWADKKANGQYATEPEN